MAEKILVVDDEAEMTQFLSRYLTRKGYLVDEALSGEAAWNAIGETVYDLVITDLALGDISGLELLERVRRTDPILPFIIITGVGSIQGAVEAIKQGAFHYVTKPFKATEIEIMARRALEYGHLHRRLDNLDKKESHLDKTAPMIIGNSKPMQDLMRRVSKISDSMASVMVMGETGTGKSLLAEHIHMNSPRRDKRFFTIDCGALAENLLESELFGHVKGAFTGAVQAKRGLLEEAQGGTIFLDEICEISPQTQVKLLRAIQEKEMKPVGGNKSVSVDVRFISATNQDVEAEVEKGNFRRDLYYRLAVVPIFLPSLKERKDDLSLLFDHFLVSYCKTYKRKITKVAPEYLQAIYNFNWKGNIRELANIVERSVILADDGVLTLDCLYTDILGIHPQTGANPVVQLRQAVEEAEKGAIMNAMRASNNNRAKASRLLGISRRTFYDKLSLYNLNFE